MYQKALIHLQWWTKIGLLSGVPVWLWAPSCSWYGSAACGAAAELLFSPMN